MDIVEIMALIRKEQTDFGWWLYRQGLFWEGARLPDALVDLYKADERWHLERTRKAARPDLFTQHGFGYR